MIDVFDWFSAAESEAAQPLYLLAEVWLRGLLILSFGFVAVRWARGTSAATRHTLLVATLSMSLLVPVLSTLVPSWSLEVPWLPVVAPPEVATSFVDQGGAVGLSSAVPQSGPTIELAGVVDQRAPERQATAPLPPVSLASDAEVSKGSETSAARPVAVPAVAAAEPRAANPFGLVTWILLFWAGGIALRSYGRFRALWARNQLARQALPAPPNLVATMNEVRDHLGIARPVRLLWNESIDIPVTWGTWRPVVLLPASAREWAPQRLRHILLHELSHVRRLDSLVQHLVWLVVTLRWIDPLVWWAAAALRREAEQACDDRVLLSGGRPAQYAGHLLEIARGARFRGLAAAVAMARSRSVLSERVEAILDTSRERRPAGWGRQLIAWAAVASLSAAIATAAVRPAEVPPTPPEPAEPATAPSVAEPVMSPSGVMVPSLPSPEAPPTLAVAPVVASAPTPAARPWPGAEPRPEPRPEPRVEPMPGTLPEPQVAPQVEPVPQPLGEPRPEPPAPVTVEPTPGVAVEPVVAPRAPDGVSIEPSIAPQVSSSYGSRAGTTVAPSIDAVPSPSWSYFQPAIDRGECEPGFLRRSRMGVSTEVDEAEWTVEITHGHCRLQFVKQGEITFADDDRGIDRLAAGASLVVEERTRAGSRSLEITPDGSGRPCFEMRIDGELTDSGEGERWLAKILPELYRRSGFQAEERVTRLLRRGGVEGVLEELPRLSTDYVVRRYVAALLEQSSPSSEQYLRIFRVVGGFDSDYERAQALLAVRPASLADAQVLDGYLRVARGIDSDYELGRTLSFPLSLGLPLGAQQRVLEVAQFIDSDYELAQLLVRLLEGRGRDALGPPLYEALRTIDSDYELRRALVAATRLPGTDREELGTLLRVAQSIESDHELAEFLVGFVELHPIEGGLEPAFRGALRSLESDYQASRVRTAWAGR